jgi:hypothetical protein
MLSRPLLAALVLTACSLAGCNPAAKVIGKWEADFSQAMPAAEDSGNPLAAMAASMLSAAKVQFEFKADGTCHATGSLFGQSGTTSSKWRYAKTEGKTLVLMVKEPGSDEEKEFRMHFTDNDHFEIVPPEGTPVPGGQTVLFKRVKT